MYNTKINFNSQQGNAEMNEDFVKVRCPACKGMKKVPKLGGIYGDCNVCNGIGSIQGLDKTKVDVVVDNAVVVEDTKGDAVNEEPKKELTKHEKGMIEKRKALYRKKNQYKE